MASVVFLRGVNVGGHRTFRPKFLAEELADLQPVNIGAAGTFVVRKPIAKAALRDRFARRLPFEVEIMICDGREISMAMEKHPFADEPRGRDLVHFMSVLSRRPRSEKTPPMTIPADGEWFVRILAVEKRYVFGVYRRRTRTIRYLGEIDKVFGVPATTRTWNTMVRIARILDPAPTSA